MILRREIQLLLWAGALASALATLSLGLLAPAPPALPAIAAVPDILPHSAAGVAPAPPQPAGALPGTVVPQLFATPTTPEVAPVAQAGLAATDMPLLHGIFSIDGVLKALLVSGADPATSRVVGVGEVAFGFTVKQISHDAVTIVDPAHSVENIIQLRGAGERLENR